MRRQQFSCGRGSIRRATVFLAAVALIAAASPALAALPALSIANAQVTEPDTGTIPAKIKVSLSRKSAKPITVKFKTVDRSAKAGQDYVAKDGTVKFPAGTKSKTIKVAVSGDTMDEKNEAFLVKLSNSKGASIDDGSAKVKIVDNDDPPSLSIADANVVEGDSGTTQLSFEVNLSQPSGKRIFVSYETEDDSGGGDFVPESGDLEFAPGDTTKNIEISVNGDALDENHEMFMIWLSDPVNATIAVGEATGTIIDDEDDTVSIADADDVTEGSSLEFPVTLATASDRQVTVNYTIVPSSATQTEPADIARPLTGQITIPAGETAAMIPVPTSNDSIDEIAESVNVTLSSPVNATLETTPTATGTIIDNDAEPVLTISGGISGEGTHMLFGVSKTGDTEKTVTVKVSTAEDTTNPDPVARATAGSDYSIKTDEVITILPGETLKYFEVGVNDDTIDEVQETFLAVLSFPTNATLGNPSQNRGSITDGDPDTRVNVWPTQIAEGSSAQVDIFLDIASSRDITFDIVYTAGTAAAGSDYTATNHGTVTIPAGRTRTSIPVATIHDTQVEGNETFTIGVTNVTNARVGTSGTITILDND